MSDSPVSEQRRRQAMIERLELRTLLSAGAPASPVPAATAWVNTDIGSVGQKGTSTANADGTISVRGGGADIWTETDAFQFDYQTLAGNGSVVTRVAGQTNTNVWAKSGIMLREDLTSDSRFVLIALTPGNGVAFQARNFTHKTPTVSKTAAGKIGSYLKLTRSGSTFTGYASADGKTWVTVGSTTITMVNNVFAGLAVTAHDNTKSSVGTFSNFAIAPTQAQASAWSVGAVAPRDRWESQSFSYNNKLFVFGGFIDRSLNATAECDVYNPSTDSWSYLTTIPTGAMTHAAVTVVGAVAYFVGGDIGQFTYGRTKTATAAVLTYDLTTNKWGSVAPLPSAQSCGGIGYSNGHLYYFGGINAADTQDLSTTYSLDLTRPSSPWVARAAMPNARNHVGYATLNNLIYAVGGEHKYDQTGGNVAEVDVYNPATNVWTKAASLPFTWGSVHTNVLVINNKIVVVGGQTNGGYDGIYIANIEAFNPSTNKWSAVGLLPEANEGESVAYIDNKLFVVDGTVDNLGGWSTRQTWINGSLAF